MSSEADGKDRDAFMVVTKLILIHSGKPFVLILSLDYVIGRSDLKLNEDKWRKLVHKASLPPSQAHAFANNTILQNRATTSLNNKLNLRINLFCVLSGNGYIEGTELDGFLREFVSSVNATDTSPEVGLFVSF